MSENKTLDFSLDVKSTIDEDGHFEGYASVFEVVDNGMDIVSRGAFTKSLAGRKVRMLWQHDPNQVIGVWDEVREDEKGLFVKGRLLKNVEKGKEAIELLRSGAIDSMSIGYRTIKAIDEGGGRVRRLIELDLHEISLVTFPMLELATVTSIKSMQTKREFEKFLRDAGFSRTEAKAIAANGFDGLANLRDEDASLFTEEEDDGEELEELDAETLADLKALMELMEAFTDGTGT